MTFSLGKRVFAFAIDIFAVAFLRGFSFGPVIVFSLYGHVFVFSLGKRVFDFVTHVFVNSHMRPMF